MLSFRARPTSAASIASVLVSERLSELVVLFKGRTELRRERLVDPDESEEEGPSARMYYLPWLNQGLFEG